MRNGNCSRDGGLRILLFLLVPSTLMIMGCQGQGLIRKPAALSLSPSTMKTSDATAFEAGANLPPSPKTLYATARILASQQRDLECETVLRRVIQAEPRFMPAYCDLGELQVRHRRFDEAINTLAAGLDVAPNDAVLLNNIGMCWLLKGKYERALRAFTQATAQAPRQKRYRMNMATALGMLGRYEECLALYEQMIEPGDVQHNLVVLHEARMRGPARSDTETNVTTNASNQQAEAAPQHSAGVVRPKP